jgi:hypothetical protein
MMYVHLTPLANNLHLQGLVVAAVPPQRGSRAGSHWAGAAAGPAQGHLWAC